MSEPVENFVHASDDFTADDRENRQHELDGLRIRQLARARQAATRAASYCIVAALACAVMAADLAWRAARRYARFHELALPAFYLLAALSLIGVIPWLARRAASLRLEARRKSLPEPSIPPDFSTLSDGSHIVRNLENMRQESDA